MKAVYLKYQVITKVDDFPLFRVQNTSHTPSVRKQISYDPAGIYFFFKAHCPEGGVYISDWKFSFEGKVSPGAKVLKLDQISSSQVLPWLEGELKSGIDDHAVLIRLCEIMQEQENWDADHYLDVAEEESEATVRGWIKKRAFWYHALKAHFNDSRKFASFFLGKGYSVLEDHDRTIWDTEEHQLIALTNDSVFSQPISTQVIKKQCG